MNIPLYLGYNTLCGYIAHLMRRLSVRYYINRQISENLLTTWLRKCIIKKLSDESKDAKSNDFEKNQKNLKKVLDKRQNM